MAFVLYFGTIFLLFIYKRTNFGILIAILFTLFKHMVILKLIYTVEELNILKEKIWPEENIQRLM